MSMRFIDIRSLASLDAEISRAEVYPLDLVHVKSVYDADLRQCAMIYRRLQACVEEGQGLWSVEPVCMEALKRACSRYEELDRLSIFLDFIGRDLLAGNVIKKDLLKTVYSAANRVFATSDEASLLEVFNDIMTEVHMLVRVCRGLRFGEAEGSVPSLEVSDMVWFGRKRAGDDREILRGKIDMIVAAINKVKSRPEFLSSSGRV